MKVAFLGLGAMGMPMAANIAKAGHALTAWNRSRKDLEGFGSAPATVADSVSQAVRGAEVVVSMLADDAAVEHVTREGLLDALAPEAVHAGASTVGIDTAKRLNALHEAKGRAYVAAPVIGRPDMAVAKKLWIISAGPAAARARARPVLEAMGRGVTEIGDAPWQASLVKLGNNFMLAAMLEAMGEAYALMRKAGIRPQDFAEIVNNAFQSPTYANYGAIIAEERFSPALFRLPLGLKDVRLVLAAADEFGVPMPTANAAHDNLLTAKARGDADLDWAVLARAAQARAGLS